MLRALAPRPGQRILSVGSGGCNSLALLAEDPEELVVVDMNIRQLHVLELKMAALAHLGHEDKLALLGFGAARDRLGLYRQIRTALSPDARAFFDEQRRDLQEGILLSGKLERYLLAFGRLLRLVLGHRFLAEFATLDDPAEQARRFSEHWQGALWRGLFRTFFSRAVLERVKDPAHFRQVEGGALGDALRARAEHILTGLPMRENFFMRLILEGALPADDVALPPYLARENQEHLASRLVRLKMCHGQLQDAFHPDTFDRFNLSNVFDWMPWTDVVALHADLTASARPGARLCWWNTLLERPMPDLPGLTSLDDEAVVLHRQDRFIYTNFKIARVDP